MISTKGRYSIRVLLDLAEHRSGDFIPMKEVAARQDISLKYIERLMPALKAAGLVESVHGIGGGYRLTREPEDYTLWEILELAEGDLAPVTCLQPDAPVCQRAGECRTLPPPSQREARGVTPETRSLDHTDSASRRSEALQHKKEPPAGGSFLPVQG